MNIRVFSAILQDRRELRTATYTSGNQDAVEWLIWLFSLAFARTPLPAIACKRMTIARLRLALVVVAGAVVRQSAAKCPEHLPWDGDLGHLKCDIADKGPKSFPTLRATPQYHAQFAAILEKSWMNVGWPRVVSLTRLWHRGHLLLGLLISNRSVAHCGHAVCHLPPRCWRLCQPIFSAAVHNS